jgi:hypothetical protein
MRMSAFFLPWEAASAAYSTVSHSRASPASSTSTSFNSSAETCLANPDAPGASATLVTEVSLSYHSSQTSFPHFVTPPLYMSRSFESGHFHYMSGWLDSECFAA